jgi:phosphatidylglycerol:prolipoprotein diacylglycerol transferase
MPPPKTRAQRQPSGQRPQAEQPAADQSGPGCAEGTGQQVLRHAVTATCWLDPGGDGQPYPVSVSFSGRRSGVSGRPRQGDRFERVETIDGLVPGGGPVSVTAKVSDVTPGEWIVWARPAGRTGQGRRAETLPSPPAAGRLGLKRFLWAKGNPVPAGNSGSRATTRVGAFATGPGLVPASWVPLVGLGVVVALAVQWVLAGREHLSTGAALAISLVASVAGAAGARAWFVALNRGKVEGIPTQGLCIQGFIVAAVAVLIAGLTLADIPIRTFLDVSAPGLFFGMAIGRQGCFLHGCCTGRLTASRWGIWASDGRVGARRVPTQQLESLACLVIGLAALLLDLQARRPAAGTVFIGAVAAYTASRQLLFPYRAERRKTSLGRRASLIAAALALVADVTVAIVT